MIHSWAENFIWLTMLCVFGGGCSLSRERWLQSGNSICLAVVGVVRKTCKGLVFFPGRSLS